MSKGAPKFAKGQVAPMEREGRNEFPAKKRKKAVKAAVKPQLPSMPSTGGLGIGL